jgi:predicted HNH restriction endonuclease
MMEDENNNGTPEIYNIGVDLAGGCIKTVKDISDDNFVLNNPGKQTIDEENKPDDVRSNAEGKVVPITKSNNQKPYIPSTVDVTKSISKVSNMIRDLAKEKHLYDMVITKNVSEQDFYTKLGNSVWKSIIQFCGIVQHDAPNNFTIPTISADSPYIETWAFFDKIYHDTRVSFEKEAEQSIRRYKKVFNVEGGISSDWISILISKMHEKMDITDDDALNVALDIKKVWCYNE